MAKQSDSFIQKTKEGYPSYGSLFLGCGKFDGDTFPEAKVQIPLSTLNRHGLIAGATGTGKTKTLQLLTESLSEAGVPVVLMDIKGDLSGLAAEGEENDKVKERNQILGGDWTPTSYPVEFLSISKEPGVKLRATVAEFGPILLSRILELNETQASVVSLVFKYCDDLGLPILDLKDFKKALQYINDEGKEELEKEYGTVSSQSVSIILRKLMDLESQGGEDFFGEPSFDVNDLLQIESKKGKISIVRLTDIQTKPRLFSTFMLSLLTEIYANFPEEGDLEKPKLVLFIDEAHLVFDEASNDLLKQLETMVRLIRSKGVGIIFCTQSPTDLPKEILGQLGLKVQHALRAFTANDRKAIKTASENYPETEFYDTKEVITELGIGEAFITALSTKGSPTPLVHTLLSPPKSRMGTLTEKELQTSIGKSDLVKKYETTLDRESAHEMLSKKMETIAEETESAEEESGSKKTKSKRAKEKEDPSFVETLSKNPLAREVGRTVAKEVTRGLLGMLGVTPKRGSRRKKTGLFGF
ncbi:MAG: helicase HerA-like domain-containing protein [Leptospira bouyouniensis]